VLKIPYWLQLVSGTAAALLGIGAILRWLWRKIIKPGATIIHETDEMIQENILKIVREMASQFRTDSGSSLKDVTNRLEASAEKADERLDQLRISMETQKVMMEQDRTLNRHQAQNLIVKSEQMWVQIQTVIERMDKEQLARVHLAAELTKRDQVLDKATAGIALDLADARRGVAGVAQDLAESHRVAGQVLSSEPAGAAADAASRSGRDDQDNRR